MAVHASCSFCVSLDFQLDAVCGVYEAGAAAVHFLARHGAQIDQKPELVFGVELFEESCAVVLYFSFMKKRLTSDQMS